MYFCRLFVYINLESISAFRQQSRQNLGSTTSTIALSASFMHRSILYYPQKRSIYSFNVIGASCSKYFGQVVGQKSACTVRSHSTEPEYELSADYGNHSIILHPENAPIGVAHHKIRSVPDVVTRPRYARLNRSPTIKREESAKLGRKGESGHLILGTDEEQRMRRSCKLAKDTLEFAASLIKVRNTLFRDIVTPSVSTLSDEVRRSE
jgi:hypothetical protein